MSQTATLEAFLTDTTPAEGTPAQHAATRRALVEMAAAAVDLARLIATPPAGESLGAAAGSANSDGDAQKTLDVMADALFSEALTAAGIGAYLSEEVEAVGLFDAAGAIAVAIDPLDGSSNIDVNAPIGTIFSILPMPDGARAEPALAFRQSGRAQLAAGFFVYGPQTSLVLTVGRGVQVFTLDHASGGFRLTREAAAIPAKSFEYAINASNARQWHDPVKRYIEACLEGEDGRSYNMRWAGSLVADAYRIFTRGGVFLYPGDRRKGYENGRLRLMYEANPVAFLAEQAGGAAIDGITPILDLKPHAPHQRAPLIMGSAENVARVRQNYLDHRPPMREAGALDAALNERP